MAKFPSKSGGGDNKGGVRLPSNTDKAIMTRTEDLLNELEQTLALSIGNVFLNTKATVTNFAQLKGKASGKSLLLSNLEDIKNSIEKVLSPDNKNYKRTYNLIKHSAESLNKLSSETFLSNVIASNTPLTIDYTEKLDEIIETVKTSIDNIVNLQGSKTVSASADGAESKTSATSATLDINVSGLDKASLDTMLNLGQLTISKDSMLSANTLHDFSNALASIGALDIKALPKDVFTYINESVIPETNKIIEGLSKIDGDIKNKVKTVKTVKTFIGAVSSLGYLKDVNISEGIKQLEKINTEMFSYIKCLIDNIAILSKELALSNVKPSIINIADVINTINDKIEIKSIIAANKALKLLAAENDKQNGITLALANIISSFNTLDGKSINKTVSDSVLDLAVLLECITNNINESNVKSALNGLTKIKDSDISEILNGIFDDFAKLYDGNITEQLQKASLVIGSVSDKESIAGIIDTINKTFGQVKFDKNIGKDLIKLADDIKKFIDKLSKSISKSAVDLNSGADKLNNSFKTVDTLFSTIEATNGKAKIAKGSLSNIDSTLGDIEKTAVGAEEKGKKAEKAQVNMANIGKFIMLCGLTMVIGAMFMMIPGMVKNSLKFGLTLGVFIAAVLLPIALINKLADTKTFESAAKVKELIVTCGIIMLIGAAVMLIPGITKNTLLFGVTLGLFIGAVLLPIALYGKLSGGGIDEANQLGKLIVTCSIVMLMGALFVTYANGKLVQACTQFGAVLGVFILMVLAPIMLYNMLSVFAGKSMEHLSKLVVSCTLVMMVGALFITLGGGKFVKAALLFGAVLGVFMLMVLAPLLIFVPLGLLAGWAIRQTEHLITKCVMLMMIGALFMMIGGGKLVMYSFAFGLALMTFITLIVTPIILFSFLDKAINFTKVLTSIATFIFVTTVVMMVGALFMQDENLWKNALLFGLLLDAFIIGVLLPVAIYGELLEREMKSLYQLALFIALSSACMLVGAMFVEEYGIEPVLEFTKVLGVFVAVIGGILVSIVKWGKLTNEGYKTLMQLNLLLIVSTACMLIGAAFINEYGLDPIFKFSAALIGFTILMGLFLIRLNKLEKFIDPGKKTALGIALVIGALSLAIIGMNVAFMLGGGIGNTLLNASLLVIIVGLFAELCKKLSHVKSIKKGLIVAGVIGGVMTLLGVAIGAMNVAFLIGGGALETLKNVGVMALIVVAFGILLAGLSLLFTPAILGAIAAAAIAIPITLLGVAIGAMNVAFLIGGGAKKTLNNVTNMIAIVVSFGSLFAYMSLLIIPATIGAIAGALIAPPITLISVALMAMNIALMVGGGANKSLKNVQLLKTIVGEMPELFAVMSVAGLAAAVAVITGALLIPAIVLVTSIVTMIGLAGKAYNSAGNINVAAIKKSITEFLSITDVCPSIFKIGAITSKLFALKLLAWDINTIVGYFADSVKQFALLQVATQWDSKGNPIRFKQLKQSDFETAANSIKSVILTLTQAIDQVTTKYPWIVKEGSDFWWKLNRVKRLSEVEGEMLSTLCESLQSYAHLLIPTKWDKNGKPINFRPMVKDDFTNAADGVEKVMTTLASAIHTTWENNTKNPNIFNGDIIEKVADLAAKEGEMLATLSDGLAHYANLMIPDKWNNKGVATHFTPMTSTQMTEAAQNIAAVMTLMAGAISLAWNGGTLKLMDGTTINVNGGLKDLESGGFFGLGGTSVKDIMESLMPMGELVSSLAEGVAQYASLQIPDKWNAKGKPVHYKTILDSDFKTAATNIQDIITCTAKGVAEGYKALNKGSWFTSVDSILENIQPLGEIVSSLAEGVAKYASLQIPIKWNANGKPIQFVSLATSENTYNASIYDGTKWTVLTGLTPFGAAAANIQSIITCLGYGVSDAYKAFNNTYDADEFKEIMDGFKSMGDFISNIASALLSYSKLQIANKWNADGKPIGFETMNGNTFAKAGENISKVVLGILFGDTNNGIPDKKSVKGGLIGAWNILEDSYDPDELTDIINAFVPIGDLISNMAEGLANYAKLQIPTEWDANGKPIGFRTLTPTDFELAGTNIVKVLSAIANSVISYANDPKNKDLFEGGSESIFGQTIAAVQGMGEMIKNISDGVNAYATGLIPWDWNAEGKVTEYHHVGDAEYNAAAKNIGTVLGVLGKSVITFADENEEYFDVKSGDSKFKIVMDSVSQMGTMIKDIAEGVNTYAQGGIPIWNDGKIVGYQKWPEGYFDKAGENIKKIITCVGEAVIELYNSDKFSTYFGDSGEFAAAIEAVGKIGNSVKGIADGVQAYANLAIPIGWGKDGKPTGYRKMTNTDITKAKNNIQTLILALGSSLIEAYDGTNIKDKSLIPLNKINENGKLDNVISAIKQISSAVEITTNIIKNISEFKVPTGFDKDGKATGYHKLDVTDITKAKDNIQSILTNIPDAINKAYNYNDKLFDPSADYIIGVQGTLPRFSEIITNTISLFKNITGNTEHFDKLFAYKQQSTVTSDNLTIGLFTDIYAILKDISGLSKVLVEFKDTKKTDIIGAGTDVETLIDVITRVINKINEFNDLIIKNEKSLSELANNVDLTSNSYILNKLNTISTELANNKLFNNLTSDIQVKISTNLATIAALLTSLYSTIQVISNEYNRNIDAINLVYNDSILFKTKSIKVYTKLIDIAKAFIGSDIKSLNNLDEDKNNIIKSLNSVKDVTNTLFATIANVYNVFSGAATQIDGFVENNILEGKDKSVKRIIANIDSFASSIADTNFSTNNKKLDALSNFINNFRTFISDNSIGFVVAVGVIEDSINNLVTNVIQEPDTADYLSSRIKPVVTDIIESTSILDVLNDSLTAVSVSQVIGETGEALNVLANGLNDVLTAIQGAQVKPQFKQNINELKAFIKESVNTLDSDKASQLTNLILALNEFMQKTGDIQGLTEAITNDLTVALDKITQKLDESNKAYELTERLQKNRHALIDNSIKKISSIMNKEIIVKVTAEMPPTQDLSGTPGEQVDSPQSTPQQSTQTGNGTSVNGGNSIGMDIKGNKGSAPNNDSANSTDYVSTNTLSRIDKNVGKIMNELNIK